MDIHFPYREEALRQVIVTPLEVQQQLVKDFGKCRLFFPEAFEKAPFAPDGIRAQISEKLAEALESTERELLQLLYVIDIPEHRFKAAVAHVDFTELLTELILQREAYKVYLRHRFRTH